MGVHDIIRSRTALELYRIVLVLVTASSNSGFILAPSRAIHSKTTEEEGKPKKRRITTNVISINNAHDDDDGFLFRHC